MEFVLVDNSVINAHIERVSRLSKGVQNLQEKMSRIMTHLQAEQVETVSQNEPVYSEAAMYDEPEIYNEPEVDHMDIDMNEYDEPVMGDPVQTFDLDTSNDMIESDDDFGLDLDAMIADMRFDDHELGL